MCVYCRLSEEHGWIGMPHLFSVSDGRHTITREIQYILLNIDNSDEFYDLEKYYQEKYIPLMSKMAPDDDGNGMESWLGEYFEYPKCKKYFMILHYAPLMYSWFGIKMTKEEIEWFNKNIPSLLFLPMPNWFNFLLFNNKMIHKAIKMIDKISIMIETRCDEKHKHIVTKLFNYALKRGLNKQAVMYSASLIFLYAGGNALFKPMIKRFEQNPEKEYNLFVNNKDAYIREAFRYHAQIVRVASSIAHREFEYKINDNIYTFPVGTPIGYSLSNVNDNIASKYASCFDVKRSETDYHDTVTFHCKDGYFDNQLAIDGSLSATKYFETTKCLNARFCPGKAIAKHHFKTIFELLYEKLKGLFCL